LKNIDRREFLKSASLSLLGASLAAGFPACAPRKGRQPNFIFFLTDDQRWDGMSCAGNTILQTPNMDRIAASGIRFSNMFVTTALCGPSRASFLTGLYSHNHGILRNPMKLSLRHRTFPEMLKDAGYETAFIGKWHNTDESRDRGFDYHFGFSGQGDYVDPKISEK
jgi:N-acetylglucosamine-6-sulfatase